MRIYVDTSVIGGCLDEEFSEESNILLDMARKGKITLIVSDVLIDELLEAPPKVQEIFNSIPDECLERIQTGLEELTLQQRYLDDKVVTENSADDALHVAAATVSQSDMIVSWNFKHIVNFQRIRGFNSVNLREGYPPIEIRSPLEVIYFEEE